MTVQDSNALLFDRLATLETRLATPVIPGEESAWLKSVTDAARELDKELRAAISSIHATQFAAMRVEDAALSAQIESLKREDRTNLGRLDDLSKRLKTLQAKWNSEINETLLTDDFEQFVNDGLVFVVNVRKQETAVQTWFAEAFRRDVGAAD